MSVERLCGLWIDPDGTAHLARACGSDGPRATSTVHFAPFLWSAGAPNFDGVIAIEPLAGTGHLTHLCRCRDLAAHTAALKALGGDAFAVRSHENAFLMDTGARLFEGMCFADLRRCQLDIETSSSVPGSFSDPARSGDRVLAIGLRCDGTDELLLAEGEDDHSERALLKRFGERLRALDPDTLEGHNIFSFDLSFLFRRCRRYRVDPAWGRFGAPVTLRRSRIRIAERSVDFMRFDIPGRAVFDTLLAVQLYDLASRDMEGYGLKQVARYFGVTRPDDGRVYIEGENIGEAFRTDRARFRAYLADDLRETAGVADLLLPTYVAQARIFPMNLQEIYLRGTGNRVDLLLIEKYHAARRALPAEPEVKPFAGAFSKGFRSGCFRDVLHFDVASLYPSLLLLIGRNPAVDSLGVFIPLLRDLREQRLRYKALAASAETPELRAEFGARQNGFKILINSFYGYLGFAGARFADGDLAAEVARRGRDLLQRLIEAFEHAGCVVLEADTDGIYLASPQYYHDPEALLARIAPVLPEGIQLEFDGRYPAMFCYKAKNYALYDGERVIVRGSALRSRGMEPFLRELTTRMVCHLLGAQAWDWRAELDGLRAQLAREEIPVARLARREHLSMSPEAYRRKIAAGGKPRRAALEVALRMRETPKMGQRVEYFVTRKEPGATSEWQRARPLEAFDPITCGYDPAYYIRKLDDWLEKFAGFLQA